MPTVWASGSSSISMSACWSRGARSEVPETLPPTVPSKLSMSSATPYSVTEVPRMGMLSVADTAACRAGVALAMIRSTLLAAKPLQMVAQVGMSPEAFCSSNSTWPGRASLMASLKPWVAASSASCCTSWQMPMVYLTPSAALEAAAEEAAPEAAGAELLPPQAVRLSAMTAESASARIFFFIMLISFFHQPLRGRGRYQKSGSVRWDRAAFLTILRELYPVLPDCNCLLSAVSTARKAGLSKAEIGDLTDGAQLLHHQDSFPRYCLGVCSTIKL